MARGGVRDVMARGGDPDAIGTWSTPRAVLATLAWTGGLRYDHTQAKILEAVGGGGIEPPPAALLPRIAWLPDSTQIACVVQRPYQGSQRREHLHTHIGIDI